VRYAEASYDVRSAAILHSQASSVGNGDIIRVRGTGFLPNLKVLLVAYPIDVSGKPIALGTTKCNARGSFTYSRTVPTLALGQYLVRAWSDDAMAAQMAESYFQVVI